MTDVRIVDGWPPNRAELVAAFNPEPGTVFAYAGTIYVPGLGDRQLPADLIAHEKTHFQQQHDVGGPDEWWRRYIDDREFRLEQEIAAYRAQWRALSGRPKRERFAKLYALTCQLGGPMYGNLVTPARSRELILAAA